MTEIKIKEFDLNRIPPVNITDYNGPTIVMIGKRGTGKSTVISSLLYNKHKIIPVGVVFSGTEENTGFYGQYFPDVFVYNDLNVPALEDFVKREKKVTKHLANPWSMCLLDDCSAEAKLLKTPLFQEIFKNGRHYQLMFILSLQYCLDIPPNIRTNIDFVFIMREPILKNRKKIFENFASIIGDFELFCLLMDELTEEYSCMVIDNTTKGNDWQDCVFWYKASPPPSFKFGCAEYQAFGRERVLKKREF